MSAVGPVSGLILRLQAELSALRVKPASADAGLTGAGASKGMGRSSVTSINAGRAVSRGARPSRDVDALAQSVARKIAAIDRDDPDRQRKAFRAFLESVLVAEWGDSLVHEPGFHQMVDSIQDQMEREPSLAAMIKQAAELLLS